MHRGTSNANTVVAVNVDASVVAFVDTAAGVVAVYVGVSVR